MATAGDTGGGGWAGAAAWARSPAMGGVAGGMMWVTKGRYWWAAAVMEEIMEVVEGVMMLGEVEKP